MPSSRITTNFKLTHEASFVDEFQNKMMEVLKIPAYDRLVIVDQKIDGFYQPLNTSGKYILFEISMFSGRTLETKKRLYEELVILANSVGVESLNIRIILNDIEKKNWGIRGSKPASELDLGFKTNV